MSVKPAAMRRLMREIAELQSTPPEGIRIQTNEDNLLDLTGLIQGPDGTPYANGYFKVKFAFTEEFPAAPPKCRMVTKIFHPNFSTAGEICVNTLKKDWQASFGIAHILVTIKCLLIHPNPESALDEEAGKLLLENYDDYCSRARIVTSVHASRRPAEFADEPASSSSGSTKPAATTAAQAPVPSTEAPAAPVTPLLSYTATSPSLLPAAAARTVSVSVSVSVPALASAENGPALAVSGKGKEREKEARHTLPAPLGPGNVNNGAGGSSAPPSPRKPEVAKAAPGAEKKAVKRAAAPSVNGAEKRKKALKRL